MEEPDVIYYPPDITAIPPSGDAEDVPTEFVAEIFALTKAMLDKLKGSFDRTEIGIVHCLAATIVASEPSQFAVSS